MFAILAVFLSGLMVGRTPELLGKKIEAREMKLTIFGTIGVPMIVLVTTALAIATEYGAAVDLQLRPAGLLRDALRLHARRPTTTARRSPGYTGFLQPADAEQFGITFANVLGGLAMLRRALPADARRARHRRLAGRPAPWRPRAPASVPHRRRHVRRRAGRRGADRRAPHLRPLPCSSAPWPRA